MSTAIHSGSTLRLDGGTRAEVLDNLGKGDLNPASAARRSVRCIAIRWPTAALSRCPARHGTAHGVKPKSPWSTRCPQIDGFERTPGDSSVGIVSLRVSSSPW
jgi:hypothetical protein